MTIPPTYILFFAVKSVHLACIINFRTYRIMQYEINFQGPSSPTSYSKQSKLKEVAHSLVQLSFEYLQRWSFDFFQRLTVFCGGRGEILIHAQNFHSCYFSLLFLILSLFTFEKSLALPSPHSSIV